MKRKIKIFDKADHGDLMNKVNAWLEQNRNSITIIDIQYQASLYHKSVMVYYYEVFEEE